MPVCLLVSTSKKAIPVYRNSFEPKNPNVYLPDLSSYDARPVCNGVCIDV